MQKKTGGGDSTLTRELVVQNKLGLHARPAAMFVRVANQFPCEINVEKDNEEVNGKSIMGLMMLAAGCGSQLKVSASGAKALEALDAIEALMRGSRWQGRVALPLTEILPFDPPAQQCAAHALAHPGGHQGFTGCGYRRCICA